LSGNTYEFNRTDEYVRQIEGALPGLPNDIRGVVESELQKIREFKQHEKASLVKGCLASIRKVCEGAATSLAAQGIAAFLSQIV
jgi:hypothetical protein